MTTFTDWPCETAGEALELAEAVAVSAAERVAFELVGLNEPLNSEHLWLCCYNPALYTLTELADRDTARLAQFVASQGAIPGEAAYRWAAAQGLHTEAADAWASQPARVRLPFETFVCTFLAFHALLLKHLSGRDIARAAEQQAELVRVPVEATIFETGAEASDRYDMGPVGTYTPVETMTVAGLLEGLAAIGLAVVSDEVPLTLTEPAQTVEADQVEPDDLADVPLPTADEPVADTGAGSSALSPPAKKGRKG